MTWQSFFVCVCFLFFFLILTVCLLRATMQCYEWSFKLKHLFSYEDYFERVIFWSKVVYIISVNKKVMAQKCFGRMGNFRSTCLKALVRMISVYHNLGILFCSLKMFGRFKTVASLDAYQIINYQFLSKTHHFCCLIFEEFEKWFLDQKF